MRESNTMVHQHWNKLVPNSIHPLHTTVDWFQHNHNHVWNYQQHCKMHHQMEVELLDCPLFDGYTMVLLEQSMDTTDIHHGHSLIQLYPKYHNHAFESN